VHFFVPVILSMWLTSSPTVHTSDLDMWVDRVEHAFRAASKPPPKRRPELDLSALIAATKKDENDVRRLLRDARVYDGMLLPLVIDQYRLSTVARAGSDYIAEHVMPLGVTHYGLAIHGDRLVVVFTRRMLTLDRFPAAKNDGFVPLDGLIARGYQDPRVLIARPSGRIESYLGDVSGGVFRSFVHFREPGAYSIEILAKGPRGQEVIGLVHTTLGKRATLPSKNTPDGSGTTKNPFQTKKALVRWINQARVRLGLRALRIDSRLMSTASDHARAMAEARQASHILPGGEGAAQRLSDAGVVTERFYENVAMARSAEQAHRELWLSPSHRKALVDPFVTHIGVGVTTVPSPGGRVLYITQHLVER
jgi:uncharacterized protein YkwD